MMNMQYCMWENTASALEQCIDDFVDKVEEGGMSMKEYIAEMSPYERVAFRKCVRLCSDMASLDEQYDNDH